MNTMSKKFRFISILALFLSLWMAIQGPVTVIAGEQKTYIKELYIVTGDAVGEYRKDPGKYMVYETALYENTYDKDVHTKTYLVAELTDKAEEAITDIKAMSMNGGYSFEKYKEYLETMKASVTSEATKMMTAVKEFRENYKKGTKEAATAYEMLNCLLYDDDQREVKENGKYMKLGDLFLSDQFNVDIMTTLLLETNGDVPTAIRTALAIACIRDEDGKTFLDKIKDEEYADSLERFDFSVYENCANGLAFGTFELRDAVKVYEEHREAYEAAEDKDAFIEGLAKDDFYNTEDLKEFLIRVNDNKAIGNTCEMFCKGLKMKTILENQEFEGFYVVQDGDADKKISLYDFLMSDESVTVAGEENAKLTNKDILNEMKYFASAMTDGLRSITGINIVELLGIALGDLSEYTNEIQKLKNDEDKEIREAMEEGISVFYGIDRDIFKEGLVAMTGAAINASTTGDDSWAQKQDVRTNYISTVKAASMYTMIASGALALGTGVAYTAYAAYFRTHYVSVGTEAIEVGRTITETAAGMKVVAHYENSTVAVPLSFWESLKGAGTKGGFYKLGAKAYDKGIPTGEILEFENIQPNPEGGYDLLYNGNKNGEYDFKTYNIDSSSGTKRTAASAAVGKVLGITFAISVLMLITSVVLYCVSNAADPVYNAPYTEIPGILCDYRTNNNIARYIYYYGATNPNGVTTQALYGASKDGAGTLGKGDRTLPLNRRGVMDLYNWELRGNRQWVCLYTTKDLYAGRPIIASSLSFSNQEMVDGSVGLNHFGIKTASGEGEYIGNSGYNLMNPFNRSIDSLRKPLKADQSQYLKPALFIHYNIDLKAEYNEKSFFASMFTTGSGWAMTGIGLVIGSVAGALIGSKTSKKKKDGTVA